MKAKAEVNLHGVSWRMFFASIVAEPIFLKYGAKLVITSAIDGRHSYHSLHYEGLALDWRSRDLGKENQTLVLGELTKILGPLGYQIILESDHFHVEYDPAA